MMHHFLMDMKLHDRMQAADLRFVPQALRKSWKAVQSPAKTLLEPAQKMSFDLCELATAWVGSDASETAPNFRPLGSFTQGVLLKTLFRGILRHVTVVGRGPGRLIPLGGVLHGSSRVFVAGYLKGE